MSNEEIIKLIKQGIDVKDNYEKLYYQNKGLIYKWIRYRITSINDIDDLKQQAYLGLVKAVEVYDENLAISNFTGVLKFYVLNSLRDLDHLPAYLRYHIGKYKKLKFQYECNIGRAPDDDYLMTKLNVNAKTLSVIRLAAASISSLDKPFSDDMEATLGDIIPDEEAENEISQHIEDVELKRMLNKILSRLSASEQDIIIRHYYDNETLEEIGNRYGLTKERIRQIINAAFRNIRKNKLSMQDLDGYIGWTYSGSLGRFNRTGTSCVEAEVIKREEIIEQRLRQSRQAWDSFIEKYKDQIMANSQLRSN